MITQTIPEQAAAPKRRRWLSFSLRSFLLAITVLGVLLGLKVSEARRQRDAVAAIRNLNGSVIAIWYDYQKKSQPGGGFSFDPQAEPGVPAWLRNICGDDFFYNVASVQLTGCVVPESVLAQLEDLPKLERLTLQLVKVIPSGSDQPRPLNDDDFQALSKLANLEHLLLLNNDDVHGTGLKELANLKRLRFVGMLKTYIDDEGMEQLGKLTSLESLSLNTTKVTAAGLGNLANMRIGSLMVHDSALTRDKLEQLGKLTSLNSLAINISHLVDEDSLRSLQELPNLVRLTFEETDLTDAGLAQVKRLTNLKALEIHGTKVTAEGFGDLKQTLLNTAIGGP